MPPKKLCKNTANARAHSVLLLTWDTSGTSVCSTDLVLISRDSLASLLGCRPAILLWLSASFCSTGNSGIYSPVANANLAFGSLPTIDSGCKVPAKNLVILVLDQMEAQCPVLNVLVKSMCGGSPYPPLALHRKKTKGGWAGGSHWLDVKTSSAISKHMRVTFLGACTRGRAVGGEVGWLATYDKAKSHL